MNVKQSMLGSVGAFILATACCWLPWLAIVIGSATGLAGIAAGLEKYSGLFMLMSAGFLGVGMYRMHQKKHTTVNESTVILTSTITCPECQFQKEETMPTDACEYFYECEGCKIILKPQDKDCCVYCSYGTVVCPPIQLNKSCCDTN